MEPTKTYYSSEITSTLLVSADSSSSSNNSTPLNTVLREATIEDVQSVYDLLCKIKAFHGRDPSTIKIENLRTHLFGEKPRASVILAEIEKKIAGFAIYYIGFSGFEAQPELCLEDLYIEEAHRRKGIGSRLFEKIEERARDNQCCRIAFIVAKDNKNAIDFYNKHKAVERKQLSIFRKNM
ncbi:MAG: GNAT family N-acetyltransferase [Verrucomicrobia bacterium]|nr:GNAT family N-acetyltransferase [Verrucomicrobiota bacterium]